MADNGAAIIRDQINAYNRLTLPCLSPELVALTDGLALMNSHVVIGERTVKAHLQITVNTDDLYNIRVLRKTRGLFGVHAVYEAADVSVEDMVKFVAAAGSTISSHHSTLYEEMVSNW